PPSPPSSFPCSLMAGRCVGCRARRRTGWPTPQPMRLTIWARCARCTPSARRRAFRGGSGGSGDRASGGRPRGRGGRPARARRAVAIGLVVSSIVGILWFGSHLVVSGEMTGGRLGQFVLYATFAAAAMAELSEVWGELTQASGAAERLAELLAVRPEIVSPAR